MEKKKRAMKGTVHASPEARKAELINAAISCFGRKGYFATTIDHIAKEASLSKGSVYRFFKSKDDVLLEILHYYKEEVDKTFEVEFEETNNPREALKTLFRTIVAFLSQHAEMERTWREFAYHPLSIREYSKIMKEIQDDTESILKQGMQEGLFIEQDVATVSHIVMAFQEGLFELSHNQSDERSDDVLARFDSCWPLLERVFVKPEYLTIA